MAIDFRLAPSLPPVAGRDAVAAARGDEARSDRARGEETRREPAAAPAGVRVTLSAAARARAAAEAAPVGPAGVAAPPEIERQQQFDLAASRRGETFAPPPAAPAAPVGVAVGGRPTTLAIDAAPASALRPVTAAEAVAPPPDNVTPPPAVPGEAPASSASAARVELRPAEQSAAQREETADAVRRRAEVAQFDNQTHNPFLVGGVVAYRGVFALP